ncbi:MAG: hypothetical protein E7327_12505 [Clostridiales bacterium]|nr:hypothetical protein [Clostridiales bacterium]
MNELENIVKSVVYGGIGAAAAIVEKGGDIARALVEKGQETVRANQGTVDQIRDTAEDLKRRVQEFCEKFMNEDVIDTSSLTPEQRDALRRQLDEQDALDREAAAACQYDEAEAEEPADEAAPAEAAPAEAEPTEEAPLSDDDLPVFEPEAPTYTAPDEP